MSNPSYKVDLKATHAECEANFWRLLKLLPESVDQQTYWVNLAAEQIASVSFEVEQRSVYTTMIKVVWLNKLSWQEKHWFTVRLYHDVGMAEVTSYQGERANQGCYYYPNQAMYHPDEKHQQNAFLADLLSHVLKHGVVTEITAVCGDEILS